MFAYRDSTAMITGAPGIGCGLCKRACGPRHEPCSGRPIDRYAARPRRLPWRSIWREFVVLQADLATSDAVKRIVTELGSLDLKIDLLINNAGLGLTGDFLSHDLAEELASIQVNVQALVGLSHSLGAKMVSRGTGGTIPIGIQFRVPATSPYGDLRGSKAFVLHFSEALKFELQGPGVQVMAVCPGPTATSFFEGVSTKMKADAFDSAELVVRRTLRSFDQKKSVAYPGRFSVRVAIWLPRLLPRNVMVSAAASATGKMGLAT